MAKKNESVDGKLAEPEKPAKTTAEKEIDELADLADTIEALMAESGLTYSQSLRLLRAIIEMLQDKALDEKITKS